MLVLSRKVGEAIVLPGRDVRIVVLAIQGSRIRVGIEAPVEEPVYREELWRRKAEIGVAGLCCEVAVAECGDF